MGNYLGKLFANTKFSWLFTEFPENYQELRLFLKFVLHEINHGILKISCVFPICLPYSLFEKSWWSQEKVKQLDFKTYSTHVIIIVLEGITQEVTIDFMLNLCPPLILLKSWDFRTAIFPDCNTNSEH